VVVQQDQKKHTAVGGMTSGGLLGRGRGSSFLGRHDDSVVICEGDI